DEARDEDGWLDEDEDSEGLNSNNMTDEDDETPLMCNGVAHKAPAAKPIVTRESNVSNAKAPFGDASKVSKHRPPLVHPIVAKIKINGYEAKALFDSGSTADLISASFVDTHKLPSFKLDEPSPL
ncbi:unnamed protein product, partial [Tilletia caries]